MMMIIAIMILILGNKLLGEIYDEKNLKISVKLINGPCPFNININSTTSFKGKDSLSKTCIHIACRIMP